MNRMEFHQLLFFLLAPSLLPNACFEVVVIPLAALLAIPPVNAVVGCHDFRDAAPFFYASGFIELSQN